MRYVRRLVPAVIRRRYAVKFGIALLVLGVSVGLIGVVATGGITAEVEDRTVEDHASFTTQEAQTLEMWNEQNEHTIETIAWSDSVQGDDVENVSNRFDTWKEHLDADIFRMDYVDIENEIVLTSTFSSLRSQDGQPVPIEEAGLESEAFDEASDAVPWVSKPYLTEDELGQQSAVVTYVLEVPRNDARAVVLTSDLEAFVTNFQDTDRVTTLVLDGDDEVMLDSIGYGEDYETMHEGYESPELLDVPQTANDGSGAARIEGTPTGALASGAYGFENVDDYLVGYAAVHGTDWVVVTHEPTSDAYGFVTTVEQYGLLATVLGVLMIGVVGVVIGRNTAVSIDRLTEKAGRMEAGDLDVEFETQRIDNIGRLYTGFGSMRDALKRQIAEAQDARRQAEAERERVQQLNNELEAAAQQYSSVMGQAATGNLTARMDPASTENASMQTIAEEFNQMLGQIEVTVAEVSQFATEVATASEEVTASSEEVRSSSEQVTWSIQQISEGAERQNESLQQVNNEMGLLSTATEEIAASSNRVADIAERTVMTGRAGQEAATQAIQAMDKIESESEAAVSEIRHLEDQVEQIDELINAISAIADQTNMLALNANIEASRSVSGDEGGGFGVVANEVKELSEDVKVAADEAEERLSSIREQTATSAEEVEQTGEVVDVATTQVQQAVNALQEINSYARKTNDGVQEISAATEEQAASTQEVVAMVDEASIISEETTSEAENVAAAAEEQTTALTEVSRSAQDLATQAAGLSEALDNFDTDPDSDHDHFSVGLGDFENVPYEEGEVVRIESDSEAESNGGSPTNAEHQSTESGHTPQENSNAFEFEDDGSSTWDQDESSAPSNRDDTNEDEVFSFKDYDDGMD